MSRLSLKPEEYMWVCYWLSSREEQCELCACRSTRELRSSSSWLRQVRIVPSSRAIRIDLAEAPMSMGMHLCGFYLRW